MTDHPITPPPELVQQWWESTIPGIETSVKDQLCTQAAQWGADQELEACCEWLRWQNLVTHCALIPSLRAARRPKPPSLKEQARDALGRFSTNAHTHASQMTEDFDLLRRALEQLDD